MKELLMSSWCLFVSLAFILTLFCPYGRQTVFTYGEFRASFSAFYCSFFAHWLANYANLSYITLRCINLITAYRSCCWRLPGMWEKQEAQKIMEFVISSTSMKAEHPCQAVGEQAEWAYIHHVALIISGGQWVSVPYEWACNMSIFAWGF